MRNKIQGTLNVLGIIGLVVALCVFLSAQDNTNLPLHEVGKTDKAVVYKMVHYGCEIFLAVGDRGNTADLIKNNPTPVSITTGRGCK